MPSILHRRHLHHGAPRRVRQAVLPQSTRNPPPDHSCPHPSCCRIDGPIVDGRNLANVTLKYGVAKKGFFTHGPKDRRCWIFAQAGLGTATFDDGATNLDVGYHGAQAFTACLIDGENLCGCNWYRERSSDGGRGVNIAEAEKTCVPMNEIEALPDSGAFAASDTILALLLALACSLSLF